MPLSKEKMIKIPKKDESGDLPKTSDEWVKYTNDLHSSGLNRRFKYEFQWTLNIAYFKGYQHLMYNRDTGTINIPKTMSRPLTINRLASFVEARHAKLTKNRPFPRPIPNTTEPEDKNAAKFAGYALKHLWERTCQEEEQADVVWFGLLCGTSFVRTLWNPFDGDYFDNLKVDKNEVLDADEDERIFLGEVSSKALSAFNLIPGNDGISNIKDQPWLMERTWMSVSDAVRYYPHLKDKIKKTSESEKTSYERVVDRLASPISAMTGSNLVKFSDSINSEVLVKTLWIRPNSEYKNGVVVVVIGDNLAHIGPFPHDYGKNIYPYAKFDEKPDGFHFWAQSSIERLMSIQRAYNRLRQKKLKNVYLMANGKWLNPKGSQVPDESFTDEEGEVIEYNSLVGEPKQAQISSLPNYAVELARELIIDMRDSGGQRESSVTPPPNLTAGVAIQIASELSDENLNPVIRRFASAMKICANQQLILINEEYIEPRKIRIFGSNNEMGLMWLSNADFRNHTDVHIEVESLFPDFRGAKQQRLLDLWDRRIIQDPTTFLRAYRFGDLDSILENIEKQEDVAVLEIQQIKKGKEPLVESFMDHGASFRVLSQWMSTPEFLRLIPERRQLALITLQRHAQFLLQSLPQESQGQTNPNAVGTPFGTQVAPGNPGNVGTQVA